MQQLHGGQPVQRLAAGGPGAQPPPLSAVVTPMYAHLEALIGSLTNSSKRDDIKYNDLREINEHFDELTTNQSYATLIDSLICAFMRVLRETTPQFISENNTLRLRKLVLELILRLTASDAMKTYTKTVQSLLLRIAIDENEENAQTIVKILTEHLKVFRPHYCNELLEFFGHWKAAYCDMLGHAYQDGMFLSPDYFEANSRTIEDFGVMEALASCFITTQLSFKNVQQPNLKYSLIPRAKQSVCVLAEMTTFIFMLIQAHCRHQPAQSQTQQGMLNELGDFVRLFIRYSELTIPRHIRAEKSYNKELVNEFHNLQIRVLTVISYTARHQQYGTVAIVEQHADTIVRAIRQLFDDLHGDVINHRRDLLVLIKLFMHCSFDIKSRLVELIPRLLSEPILIGTAYTARDQLRAQAYTLLADILHHCRLSMSFRLLTHVFFFSARNSHDPHLQPHIQTMYAKLLMNFVELLLNAPKQNDEQQQVYDNFLSAAETYVRKARFLVDYHLPMLREKYRVAGRRTPQAAAEPTTAAVSTGEPTSTATEPSTSVTGDAADKTTVSAEKPAPPAVSADLSISVAANIAPQSGTRPADTAALSKKSSESAAEYSVLPEVTPMSLNDFRNTMKFIFLPMKMLVSKLRDANPVAPRKELDLMFDYFIYGLKCLDVFTVIANAANPCQKGMRMKEEKEQTDLFIAAFICLEPAVFHEIVEDNIDFFIERLSYSAVLQSVCNATLAQVAAGPRICGSLMKYLLNHLPEMGANNDNAFHYLNLFKLTTSVGTFSQVPQITAECANILTPYISKVLQESIRLALTSLESINYFRLLRALFRSIGSGTHDVLYQQFLPQLPSILQKLNRLQNSAHRQTTHELFAELCLTVPVRLSSLLPYLPLLMDPLVSSMHGTSSLIQQGIRTLELCVDNLQPEYFYDHMYPVRASLLPGLWRTVSSADHQTALSAFRILGKFGGTTRKVLLDARTIDYMDAEPGEDENPALFEILSFRRKLVKLEESTAIGDGDEPTEPISFHCDLVLQQLVDGAAMILNWLSNADTLPAERVVGVVSMGTTAGNALNVPRMQALDIVKTVLLAAIRSTRLADMGETKLREALAGIVQRAKARKAASGGSIATWTKARHTTPEFTRSRRLYSRALAGLFYAVVNNELKPYCLTMFRDVIKYFTLQSILQIANEEGFVEGSPFSLPLVVLVDAMRLASADSCIGFFHPVVAALKNILVTAQTLFDDDGETACNLPQFDYMLHQMSLLCFRSEWFARLGGCTALRYILEHYPPSFVRRHAAVFLNCSGEVATGLADEVSFGAIDYAEVNTDVLIMVCFPLASADEGPADVDEMMLRLFLDHVVERLNDAEPIVRKEAFRILNTLTVRTNQSAASLLRRFETRLSQIFIDSIANFVRLSIDSQIAFLELYVFISQQTDLALDCLAGMPLDFIRNLLIVIDPAKERMLVQLQSACGDIAQSSAKGAERLLPLRLAAIEAITLWCCRDIVAIDELKREAFTQLLDNALLMELDQDLREKSKEAVEKIFNDVKLEFECNSFGAQISERMYGLFAETAEGLNAAQIQQLLFLGKLISRPPADENLRQLKDWTQKTLKMDSTVVSASDLKMVLNIIHFFYYVSHRDMLLFRSVLLFLRNHEEKLRVNKEPWLGILARYTFLNDETATFLVDEIAHSDANATGLVEICVAILAHAEGGPLRKALIQQQTVICQALESILAEPAFTTSFISNVDVPPTAPSAARFCALLRIVRRLVELDSTWFASENGGIVLATVRRLWASEKLRTVFVVRREYASVATVQWASEPIGTSMYEVPVHCANILIARLRHLLSKSSPEDDAEILDVIYDLVYVFCYTFISDFSFVRAFIDNELIPSVSLPWRRAAFARVIATLKALEARRKATGVLDVCDDQLVRFMQFVVVPSIHYAFEKFDVDAVVGSTPDMVKENDDTNLMSCLVSYIDVICSRNTGSKWMHCMSDSMTVVVYHFCVLLVRNCPLHILDATKKSEKDKKAGDGKRLRSFMLFGWPCLHVYHRDVSEKYSGYLLIANIIDRFAINRTIVMQVMNNFITDHDHDHRDIVRKAVDVLVPAISCRMDDGHVQLYTIMKKAILEDSRTEPKVALYCLNIVIRHHKIFYVVRHQFAPLILSALQRILGTQHGYESRRLVVEICDMFIKWEQERQRMIEANANAPSTSSEMQPSSSQGSLAAESSDGSHLVASSNSNSPGPSGDASNKSEDVNRSLDKSVVNEVIYLLVKTAIASSEQTSSSMNANHEQLSKRSILLFRLAMKPHIFGNVAMLLPQWFENHLILPSQSMTGNEQAVNQQLAQVLLTLEFFSTTISHLPQPVVVSLFRPLQPKLMDCLNTSNVTVIRNTFSMLNRLFDKCTVTAQGIVEFEMLNQFILKYIHDHFASYVNSSAAVQPTLLAITLLRSIHNIQPAYLETMCLNAFLKMSQRLVRDYNPLPSSTKPADKFYGDALCVCLEILCPRMKHLSFEANRSIAQNILVPLIEKGAVDKVLEALVKIVHELVIDNGETRDAAGSAPSNGQSGGGFVNLGVGLLIRMCICLEARLTANADLLCLFLESVLFVFENERFRNLSDITSKMNAAFFWGMSCGDHSIRNRCFHVLEHYFPRDPFHRLVFVLTKQNWQSFGEYFWIVHVAHLLLLSNDGNRLEEQLNGCAAPLFLTKNIATVSALTERIVSTGPTSSDATERMNVEVKVEEMTILEAGNLSAKPSSDVNMDNEPMDVDDQPDQEKKDDSKDEEKPEVIPALTSTQAQNELFNSYYTLLRSAASAQSATVIANIVDYLHYDWQTARIVFIQLFRSYWTQLTDKEREEIERHAQAFLASAAMTPQKGVHISAAAVILEAFAGCEPPMRFTPPLLSYIGATHNCWHFSVGLLEREAVQIRLSGDVALKSIADESPAIESRLEVLENLALLYTQLNEPDQLWMVWRRRCCFQKTTRALALLNQGEYALARELFEKMTTQARDRIEERGGEFLAAASPNAFIVTPAVRTELKFWEDQWVRSCKELADWTTLTYFANNANIADAGLMMTSAWHMGEWPAVGECITQVDASGDPKLYAKSTLYKTMLTVRKCDPGYKETVDRSLLEISKYLIAEWRSLPRIVSTSHLDLLIESQLVHEVQEANSTLHGGAGGNLGNMKHVMKSWRSRSLTQVDPPSAWHSIFNWRCQHYANIMRDQQSSFLLCAVTQTRLTLARSLRRSNLVESALNELHTLNTLPSVLPADGQLKICEEVKCSMLLAAGHGDPTGQLRLPPQALLEDALCVIDEALPEFYKKEQSRLIILKASLLSRLNRRDEASSLFLEAAANENGTAAGGSNSLALWKSWGCHLEKFFLSNPVDANASKFGVQALVCFLECAKLNSYLKSRPHIARVFWLIKSIAAVGGPPCLKALEEALAGHLPSVASINWLFWLDEIISDIRQRTDGGAAAASTADLLRTVAEAHPQQTLYALRTALGPAVVGQRLAQLIASCRTFDQLSANDGSKVSETTADCGWRERCLRAVDALYRRQSINVTHLNELLDEMDNFRQTPLEELLHRLRELLNLSNDQQFASISELTETKLRKNLLSKAAKLDDFLTTEWLKDAPLDNTLHRLTTAIRGELRLVLNGEEKRLLEFATFVRRAVAVVVQALRMDTENRQFFMRNTSSALARFKNKLALVEIFNGHTKIRVSNTHTVHIAHFIATYRVMACQSGVRRLIQIRGLNGKFYAFFLERVHDGASRAADTYIGQLFTMLNTAFAKDRGMCQRLMQLAIPRAPTIGERHRLVECGPRAGRAHHFRTVPPTAGGRLSDDDEALTFHTFLDIFDEMLRHYRCIGGNDTDRVVDRYYERLADQRYCHKALVDVFGELSPAANGSETTTVSEGVSVPRDLLKRWMAAKYPNPAVYWTVRRNLAMNFALMGLVEHAFFLTPLQLDDLYIDLSTSQLLYGDYRFDLSSKVSDKAGAKISIIELDGNRPVGFRMSSNIAEYLHASLEGHVSGAILATAKCLSNAPIERILRPLLWDVFYEAASGARTKSIQEGRLVAPIPLGEVIGPVEHALETILGRIRSYIPDTSQMERAQALLHLDSSHHADNLCRMDPNWHPWF